MPDERNNTEAARILVCEDEAIIAEDVAGTLKDLGYKVPGIGTNGEDAEQIRVSFA